MGEHTEGGNQQGAPQVPPGTITDPALFSGPEEGSPGGCFAGSGDNTGIVVTDTIPTDHMDE